MNKCTRCGSYAINPHLYGRDDTDLDLCDVCYWRKRSFIENLLPIEMAPKDQYICLFYNKRLMNRNFIFGKWDWDESVSKPVPHWTNDLIYLVGKKRTREIQPTHYLFIPEDDITYG